MKYTQLEFTKYFICRQVFVMIDMMQQHSCVAGTPKRDLEGKAQGNNIDHDVTKTGKLKLIKAYLIDYSANSNLHGLKYIGEKERSSVEKRQCYFPSERYLRYFKVYTQANCELECLSNYTYARCGCVPFAMPRGPNMSVCNVGSMQCVKAAQRKLVTIEIESRMNGETDGTLGDARAVAAQCKCLLPCISLEYEAETSQVDIDYDALFKARGTKNKDIAHYYSKIIIYFKESQFIASRRSELYGRTDFLANCGGLLGLFMGFSILSVVEIIYFLTLRLYSLLRRQRRTSDSTKNEILSTNVHLSVD